MMKMFQKIQEILDDRDALVCVLIDEVSGINQSINQSITLYSIFRGSLAMQGVPRGSLTMQGVL